MGLTHLISRDRNYYSVLLNTFHICMDSEKTQRANSRNANNTQAEGRFNDQFKVASLGVEPGASNSRKEDWDKY